MTEVDGKAQRVSRDEGPFRVAWGALPDAARGRLLAYLTHADGAEPLLEDRRGALVGDAALAVVPLGITALLLGVDFGESLLPWSAAEVAFALLTAAAGGALGGAHRVALGRRLPFVPGRYVLPLDFVDAREAELRVVPLRTLREVLVAHDYDGKVYRASRLTLVFQDGRREGFGVSRRELATTIADELCAVRDSGEAALDEEDLLRDPFRDVREHPPVGRGPGGPLGRTLDPGRYASRALMRWALAAVVGAALAVPAVWVRNRLSDDAMYARATALGTEAAVRDYLVHGQRHAAQANDALPRAALADAKRVGTVTAIRDFLAKHPGSPVDADARRALHDAYGRALAKFAAQAEAEDPKLLPFMQRLLDWLEDHELARVETRFRSPTSAMLRMVDDLLSDPKVSSEGEVAKVAPHFDAAHALPREAAITKRLAAGFANVFPADVLHVEPGAPGEAPAGADDASAPPVGLEVPTIDVSYKVGWSGDVYGEADGKRKFVGIALDFNVVMRIPGKRGAPPNPADTFRLKLSVAPPDSFDVHYKDDEATPTPGRIYDVMADRAFDELDEKLRAALIGKAARAPRP